MNKTFKDEQNCKRVLETTKIAVGLQQQRHASLRYQKPRWRGRPAVLIAMLGPACDRAELKCGEWEWRWTGGEVRKCCGHGPWACWYATARSALVVALVRTPLQSASLRDRRDWSVCGEVPPYPLTRFLAPLVNFKFILLHWRVEASTACLLAWMNGSLLRSPCFLPMNPVGCLVSHPVATWSPRAQQVCCF